jgi:predicted DNA-binding transcriptional regulator AlpA
MDTPSTPLDAGRLAVTARDAARLLGISRAQLYRLHSSGRLPQPVYLGTKAPRWSVTELRAWLAAGAPPRDQWERQKREGRP